MSRDQRFLVALGNTEHDVPLLHYARLLAECSIARELRFVHVATFKASWAENQPQENASELSTNLTMKIARHFGDPPPGVTTSQHSVAGEPVDGLLEFATSARSDVILLGHRRERSGQRSLARRLAIVSPASVWLVPEGAPVSIRRILAPVDFSKHSADGLSVASRIASAANAERTLALHVHFDESSVRYAEHVAQERKDLEQSLRNFLAAAATPGSRIEPRLEEGPFPSRTILRVAEEEAADLIVMNTRGLSRAAAILLGSVTTQVMVESPVSVLAVKHFGAAMGLFQALKESQFWQHPLPKSN